MDEVGELKDQIRRLRADLARSDKNRDYWSRRYGALEIACLKLFEAAPKDSVGLPVIGGSLAPHLDNIAVVIFDPDGPWPTESTA